MSSTTLDDYIAAHEQLFGEYVTLCEQLTDEQLAGQSLCPAWTVKQVIAHAIGVETVLQGWTPSVENMPPFERMGEFDAEAGELSGDAFTARIAEVTSARLAELQALEPSIVDEPSVTPAGAATYGRFLQVRVFDLWVHLRDISLPLGLEIDNTGITAEMALAEVGGALGYVVGKKIALPDGMSIVFHVRGDVDADFAVVVDGRAAAVDAVDEPDVVVTTDIETFVMLAAGRVDPQDRIDAGRISWTGNDEWGDKAARNLAYTT